MRCFRKPSRSLWPTLSRVLSATFQIQSQSRRAHSGKDRDNRLRPSEGNLAGPFLRPEVVKAGFKGDNRAMCFNNFLIGNTYTLRVQIGDQTTSDEKRTAAIKPISMPGAKPNMPMKGLRWVEFITGSLQEKKKEWKAHGPYRAN